MKHILVEMPVFGVVFYQKISPVFVQISCFKLLTTKFSCAGGAWLKLSSRLLDAFLLNFINGKVQKNERSEFEATVPLDN